MGSDSQTPSEIVLLKSEIEAAAARVAERAMNQTVDGMGSLVGDFFGGLLGDRMKQWRTRNLIDSLVKTKEHFDRLGIPIEKAKSLPNGHLFEIFDGMSKQDDPVLSEMWAGLLTSAMMNEAGVPLDPHLPKLLGQLSGLDAVILDFYARMEPLDPAIPTLRSDPTSYYRARTHFSEVLTIEAEKIAKSFTEENISLALSNMIRIGLLFRDDSYSDNGDLIEVNEGPNGFIVEYKELNNELSYLYEAVKKLSNDETNHKLIDAYYDSRLFLPYNMTAVAKRLIDACRI